MADISPFRGIRYREGHRARRRRRAALRRARRRRKAAGLRARAARTTPCTWTCRRRPARRPTKRPTLRAAATFRGWRDEGSAGARRGARHQRRRPDVHGAGLLRQRTRRGLHRATPARRPGTNASSCRTSAPTPAPRSDRLRLYRAVHADVEPHLPALPRRRRDRRRAAGGGRGGDRGGRLARPRATATATGTRQRSSPARRPSASARPAVDRQVYIADGHHRYETALAYRDELRAAGVAGADT